MPFIPDTPEQNQSIQSGFVPDEPVQTGFIPDDIQQTGFIPDPAKQTPEQLEQKLVTGLPSKKKILWAATKTALKNHPIGLYINELRPELVKLKEKGKDFWKKVIAKIPDPKERTVVDNFLIGLPKTSLDIFTQVSMEMADPLTWELGAGGKALGTAAKSPAGKQVIKQAEEKIPEWIRRAFSYRFKQPTEYIEAAESRIKDIATGTERALETAKPITVLSSEKQKAIGRYMKGETDDIALELKPHADKARDEFTRLGQESVDLGLLPKEIYEKNIKTYLPRFYKEKELAKQAFPGKGVKPQRIDVQRFKKRQDIPEDIRESMGEILEAGYPTAKGLAQLEQAVATAKLFKNTASNPAWATNNADDAVKQGFVQMKIDKKLGDLSGKYVHPEIARDVNEITKVHSTATKIWKSLLNDWKFAKVILNPATHSRNVMANTILLDLSGLDHGQQLKMFPRVIKDYVSKGKYYKEAKESGLLGHEFYGGEVKEMLALWNEKAGNNVVKMFRTAVQSAGRKAGAVYQSEEQVFKLMKFTAEREKGLTVKQALNEAEKWVFNYEKVSPAIKTIRQSPIGAPFITFSSKALPRVAETAMFEPVRLLKYKYLFDAIEDKAQESLGISDLQKKLLKQSHQGTSLILPMADQLGRPYVLDLSYILPWGDVGEQGGAFGLPGAMAPSGGPVKAGAELALNRSQFLDKPIFPKQVPARKGDIPAMALNLLENTKVAADYLYKNFAPSFAVEIPGVSKGSYSYYKLKAAMMNKPDYYGIKRTQLNTILDVFLGLKARPVDIKIMAQRAGYRQQDLERELSRQRNLVLKDQSISKKEKAKAVELYQQKMKDLGLFLKDERFLPR